MIRFVAERGRAKRSTLDELLAGLDQQQVRLFLAVLAESRDAYLQAGMAPDVEDRAFVAGGASALNTLIEAAAAKVRERFGSEMEAFP